MTKVVAIHQPNFFPWLGYFDKICRSDIFILLDDVQYQKTGGTWSNRVQVQINGEGRWITAPIDRAYHGTKAINEVMFACKEDWRDKILRTVKTAYGRAPYFREAISLLEPLIMNPEQNVAEYNIHAILSLSRAIGLDADSIIRSSSMPSESVATQRLIDLTLRVGGQQYLCGGGASGYQEDEAFADANIFLMYQGFIPIPYTQALNMDFIAGLSIIDALMNVGSKGIRGLMGLKKPATFVTA